MIRQRKIISVLLASVLTASLLLGCGSQGADTDSSAAESDVKVEVNGDGNAAEVTASEEAEIADNKETTGDEAGSTGTTEQAAAQGNEAAAEESEELAGLMELCSDYFKLGVGINGSTLENQTLNIPEYMELSAENFNSVTMTNLMKSCYILNQAESKNNLANGNAEPALSFDTIDPTLEWCKENGMQMRGHTLVWHTQAPEWFFREGYEDNGAYVDKETMLLRMESYIRQLLTHVQENYPGVIYCWDVVNEAVDPDSAAPGSYFSCRTKIDGNPNPWYETIGEDYVEMAFTYARKYADPEVKLFYNDFNTYMIPKQKAIVALCESLKEKGLIDGIGMQGYWGMDYPPITTINGAITEYAKLDLEIQITELSIGVDEETEEQFEKQAKTYGRVFVMLHDLDTASGGPANITSVTLFGLVDHYREGDTTNSRIFDKDYQPKPAYDKIRAIFENYYKK